MRKGKGVFYLAAVTVLLLLVAACVSQPDVPDEKTGGTEEPDWIVKYPVDPEYFIGIGSSNTGDRGADMDTARLDALAALSSSIVTKIEAEIVVESSDDSEGNSYEKITQRIQENVKQNLKGVEPVDSYYSKDEGYWFYFRFPKVKLEEMKQDLTRRVEDLVVPSIEGEYPSVAEGLALLWDGFALIQDSPFVGTIKVEIGSYSGAFIDILQKEISRLSASLSIGIDPEEISIEQGQNPEVNLFIENDLGIPTGQIHAVLTADGSVVSEVVTTREGTYDGKIELTNVAPGRSVAAWKADFSGLGIDSESVRLFIPETSVFLEVEKKSVGLRVETGSGEPFQGLSQSVSSLFSDTMPFEIVDGYTADKTNIIFTLHFRDLPENDFGLFFTYARAVISVDQAGKTLYSYESDEFKEGGITVQQARERGKAKLFDTLKTDSAMYEEIIKAATLK